MDMPRSRRRSCPGLACRRRAGLGDRAAVQHGSRCHLGPLRFGATTGIVIGITYGLVYGITFAVGYRSSGLATPAFMTFMIARTWLALQRKLPWALMPYLEDAH